MLSGKSGCLEDKYKFISPWKLVVLDLSKPNIHQITSHTLQLNTHRHYCQQFNQQHKS